MSFQSVSDDGDTDLTVKVEEEGYGGHFHATSWKEESPRSSSSGVPEDGDPLPSVKQEVPDENLPEASVTTQSTDTHKNVKYTVNIQEGSVTDDTDKNSEKFDIHNKPPEDDTCMKSEEIELKDEPIEDDDTSGETDFTDKAVKNDTNNRVKEMEVVDEQIEEATTMKNDVVEIMEEQMEDDAEMEAKDEPVEEDTAENDLPVVDSSSSSSKR